MFDHTHKHKHKKYANTNTIITSTNISISICTSICTNLNTTTNSSTHTLSTNTVGAGAGVHRCVPGERRARTAARATLEVVSSSGMVSPVPGRVPREIVYSDNDLSVSGLERQFTEITTFLSSMWFQLLYSPNKTVLITHYQRRGHFYSGPDNKPFAKLCLGRQFTASMTFSLQPKLKNSNKLHFYVQRRATPGTCWAWCPTARGHAAPACQLSTPGSTPIYPGLWRSYRLRWS